MMPEPLQMMVVLLDLHPIFNVQNVEEIIVMGLLVQMMILLQSLDKDK
jgi:D-hexose-6-phosphate mutarotase